ncbi:hypothetical protein Tco_0529232 [Tanacetum coccineum]
MRSIISMVSISLEDFLPSILLLMVIIVAVVIVTVIWVVVVDVIVGVVFVVIIRVVIVVVVMIIGIVVIVASSKVQGFETVTFPSMLWGSPSIKASISFSEFGTMFGHKTANSWILLTLGDLVGLLYSDGLGVCIPPGQGIFPLFATGNSLGPVFLLGLSAFAMVAACASRVAAIPLVISYRMAASVIVGAADVDVLLASIYMQDNTE